MPDESLFDWNAKVLILRLRFRSPGQGRKDTRKVYINSSITVGVDAYDINSAILHHGRSGESGHYTCLAKMDANWFVIDDNNWKQDKNIKKTLRQIQGGYSNCSYILMYIKRDEII